MSAGPVERDDALRELPSAYAVGLRMRARGNGDAEIAAVLGIEREAVGPLLEVAERKLESVLNQSRSSMPCREPAEEGTCEG
jgi:hypothetical protein